MVNEIKNILDKRNILNDSIKINSQEMHVAFKELIKDERCFLREDGFIDLMRIFTALKIDDQFRNGLSPYPTRLNIKDMSVEFMFTMAEKERLVSVVLIENLNYTVFENIFKAMFQYYSYYIDHKIQTWEEKNS